MYPRQAVTSDDVTLNRRLSSRVVVPQCSAADFVPNNKKGLSTGAVINIHFWKVLPTPARTCLYRRRTLYGTLEDGKPVTVVKSHDVRDSLTS